MMCGLSRARRFIDSVESVEQWYKEWQGYHRNRSFVEDLSSPTMSASPLLVTQYMAIVQSLCWGGIGEPHESLHEECQLHRMGLFCLKHTIPTRSLECLHLLNRERIIRPWTTLWLRAQPRFNWPGDTQLPKHFPRRSWNLKSHPKSNFVNRSFFNSNKQRKPEEFSNRLSCHRSTIAHPSPAPIYHRLLSICYGFNIMFELIIN